MRPRRGTPWKGNSSMARNFWKSAGFNAATEGNSVERAVRSVPRNFRQNQWRLQCGHGGELRGKFGASRSLISQPTLVVALQCGHGGELRGKSLSSGSVVSHQCRLYGASMRPRRGTPWKDPVTKPRSSTERKLTVASMRPRRGTPWKAFDSELQRYRCTWHASMRPRRGTPWKVSASGLRKIAGNKRFGFNAATEGNSVESWHSRVVDSTKSRCTGVSMRPRRGTPWKDDRGGSVQWQAGEWHGSFQCGHGGELRGKTTRVGDEAAELQLHGFQCGHGGELRGKPRAGRRSRQATCSLLASMRPRRGTPWKGRIAAGTVPEKLYSPGLQCGHGGELRGKTQGD
jgi:hypothetical protein